jgi:hypothetical protein
MRNATFALAVVTVAILTACDRHPTEPPETVIRIRGVGVPATVAAGQTFSALFHAGECYSLSRVDRDLSDNAEDLVFVGVSTECPRLPPGWAESIPFAHFEQIQAPAQGELSIRVHEPDGSVLTKLVAVSVGSP